MQTVTSITPHHVQLSCLHLQGTVSRKGSMTGGWTGSSGSYAKTYWTNKQHHDYILHQLSAVQQQLSTAEVHSLTLQQQRTAAEEQLVSAQQRQQLLQEVQEAQADAAAAAAALAQEQQQLRELQEHSADLQQRLQQYKTALGQANDKPVSGPESSRGQQGKGGSSRGGKKGTAGGKSAAAQLLQQMHAEADMAAVAVTAAEQQLEEAQEKVNTCVVQRAVLCCVKCGAVQWVMFWSPGLCMLCLLPSHKSVTSSAVLPQLPNLWSP